MAEGAEERRPVVFSGMRPTSRLHVGNLMGALAQWVRLQEGHRCFYCVVDWHALTTEYEDPRGLRERTRDVAADYLAAGVDPKRSVVFVQSEVKEHAELHLLLSMVIPVSWLERVPTYKDQVAQLAEAGKDVATYGFLGYPVLQAADILAHKGELVPVGKDQLPHIELTREVARRFNHLYGPVFPEPQTVLSEVDTLPGVDGRKMSKSYGNDIPMTAEPEEIRRKVDMMVTDPARARRTDPGHPDVCTVYAYRRLFAAETVDGIGEECRRAGIGCVDCKAGLAEAMTAVLEPIRERKARLEADPGLLDDVLADGAARARESARATLDQVRAAVGV